MTLRFDGKVAIVTGAGNGLGRSHALELAKRGARVVVNDLGASVDGAGRASSLAERVAEEIRVLGGEALASTASVTDWVAVQEMVAATLERFGRVDILVNNAGILRDKSFAKMDIDDFKLVLDVHLIGAVHCSKAVWDIMREQQYGRIVMTTSSSGLYGNFGQSNYSAAKMALVGLMQTLAIEGAKSNIRVNCLAPTAATRMTEGLIPAEHLALLAPEAATPALIALVGEDAPTRAILCAGAGGFERAYVSLTRGIYIAPAADCAEQVSARLEEISDREEETVPESGAAQTLLELGKAFAARAA